MERDKRATAPDHVSPTSKRLAGLTALGTSPTVELSPRSAGPTEELPVAPPSVPPPRRATRTRATASKAPRPGEYRMTRRKGDKSAACRLVSVAHGQVELVLHGQSLVLDVQDARSLAALLQRTLG